MTALSLLQTAALTALTLGSAASGVAIAQTNPAQPGMPGMSPPPAASPAGAKPDVGSPAQGRTRSPAGASVYFIDLKDGARVPLKVHVRIGLLKMGVAPASVPFAGTGHHHILIDAPLPAFDEPIPADDNHIHLGGGETERDIDLSPGPHTLQLLMGDQDHVPHDPPVFSPAIHVVAALPRTPSRPRTEVYFISPHDGDVVPATSTVRFGLTEMGVAPASVTRAGTGHHHLIIDAPPGDLDTAIPTDDKHLHFGGGQTEADITLPPGSHTLQLIFADQQHRNFEPPILSKQITVTVK